MSASLAFVDRLKRHVVGESLVRRNPFYYERSRRLLERLEREDLAGRRAWTREHLSATLAAARRTVYGHDVRGAETLESWPLLRKERLRGRLEDFTTGREWFSAPAVTGGTQGVPLRLVRSLDGIVFEQACMDRVITALGLNPKEARMATIRGDNVVDPRALDQADGVSSHGGRHRLYCARAVSPQNIERIAESIGRFRPDIILGYPSAIETLCRLLVERRHRLQVPAVLTSSEVMKPAAWTLIREVLGSRICDQYGQSERLSFAYALEPREYRFLAGYSFVEFLAHDGLLPADSSDRIYEIVGTSFWNSLMPLVRYRTGDLIRVPADWGAAELEELALGLRSFTGILGREQEVLVCPEGVRLTGFETMPLEVERVLRIQIVQETIDSARIRVVAAPGFNEGDARRLLENAQARLPATVHLTLEIAQWLERTPRGKTPLIIHRPPVHDALRRAGIEPLATQ